jgi:hypothetical protein
MTMEEAVASLEKSASRLSKSGLSDDIKHLIAAQAPKQRAVLLGLKGEVKYWAGVYFWLLFDWFVSRKIFFIFFLFQAFSLL